MKNTVKKTALLGLFAALAIVFAYIEVLLPPIFTAVPGIKLGLPNIVIVFVLYRAGLGEAAAVSLVRILAVSLLFGNFASFAYSVAGAVLSLGAMALLKRLNFLSTVGVSVAGGVLHNVGQILVAMLLLGTAELGYYLIVLAMTGTLSGILVGICGGIAVLRVPAKYI
ncbi:MAG: Gx transporter family protein [Ruminococcaceae bacterium]|nr:Gx transporter family protein [Oscillospiraceae bacterium]